MTKKKNKLEEPKETVEIGYNPLGDSEPFGMEEMFAQGAAALDLAAIFALERQDVDALISVGREWTRMAKAIGSLEVIDEEKRPKIKFGFGHYDEEEEQNGSDTGTGTIEANNPDSRLRKSSIRVRINRPSARG